MEKLQVTMKIASLLLIAISPLIVAANENDFQKVSDAAASNNCELDISEEVNSPFLLTPEYMIFWCKKNGGDGYYDLLAFNFKSDKWEPCGSYIPVQSFNTMPIWVEKTPKPYGRNVHLNEFWYIDERNNDNENNYLLAQDTVIEGSFNYGFFDQGQILYCHNGKWSMYGYH